MPEPESLKELLSSEYFQGLPEDRKFVVLKVAEGESAKTISQRNGHSVSYFYTWRSQIEGYHEFLKKVIKLRSKGPEGEVDLFYGSPTSPQEMQRRALVLRIMNEVSALEVEN